VRPELGQRHCGQPRNEGFARTNARIVSGLPAESVRAAEVEAKGSRPFAAADPGGRRWFIKALGSDHRDADLLYRAYRAVRLRNAGDTRPAGTLFQAVEHPALVGVMAERAGVVVPGVERVVKAGGDTALLVLDWVDGSSLEQLPPGQITDDTTGPGSRPRHGGCGSPFWRRSAG